MIGIPIDLHPEFPTNADSGSADRMREVRSRTSSPKSKASLRAGKSVVITSGLLHALQGKGIEDIVEVRYTDRKFLAHEYLRRFWRGQRFARSTAEPTPTCCFRKLIF